MAGSKSVSRRSVYGAAVMVENELKNIRTWNKHKEQPVL
jgi:hypothetical protein